MLRKIFALSFGLVSIAAAQNETSFRCELGGNVRRVEIMYETGVVVPCEVHYIKETEAPGTRDALWRAQNESGYCEARAQEFVARLESLGWSCSAQLASPPEDDTDVLGAAEDSEEN
jgi:hypothetical protein